MKIIKGLCIHNILLMLFAFSLTFSFKTTNILLILLALLAIESIIKKRSILVINLKDKRFAIIAILIFFFSTLNWNLNNGSFLNLNQASLFLPLVFLPLILWSLDSQNSNLKALIQGYFAGLVSSSIICLIYAFYRSIHFGANGVDFIPYISDVYIKDINGMRPNYFLYTDFSVFIHPIYYSVFLLIGIQFLTNKVLSNIVNKKKIDKIYIILILFFSSILVLLSSRAAYLVLFVIILIALVSLVKMLKGKYRSLLMIFFSVIIFGFISFINPRTYYIKNYLENFWKNNELLLSKEYKVFEDQVGLSRLILAKVSIDLIGEKPYTGYGNSNVKLVVKERLDKYKISFHKNEPVESHSIFLNVLLSTGLVGFVGLLFLLSIPLYYSLKNKEQLYLQFLMIFLIIGLFESLLDRAWGVYAFSIIMSLSTVNFFSNVEKK